MRRKTERNSVVAHVVVRIADEQHAFICPDCDARWAARYELREYRGAGTGWSVYCRDGRIVRPPSFGDACPTCGLVSVTRDPDAADAVAPRMIRTSLG